MTRNDVIDECVAVVKAVHESMSEAARLCTGIAERNKKDPTYKADLKVAYDFKQRAEGAEKIIKLLEDLKT